MSYFEQKLQLDVSKQTQDRFRYFTDICKEKSVLHVGFVDYPITDPKMNMHLMVDKVCQSLVGIDPNYETYKDVKPLLKHPEMYGDYSNVATRKFDIVIVPEVIEHVGNVEDFLKQLNSLQFDKLYISAPNAFECTQNGRYNHTTGQWTENIHPDHNYWFSPYTLNNTVLKYTNLKNENLVKLKWGSVVGVYVK